MIETPAAFGLLAGALGAADTVPYLRDTLRRTTVPHRGSWLIWGVLEVVAVESQRADGARWSLVPLVTQALGTCLVFGLAVRLGSGGVNRVDLALIALAGVGVAGWLAADEPVIATGCVIAADFVAALMMLPKTWRDPHSETLSTFALAALGGAAMVGAVGVPSVALLVYPAYFTLVNAALAWVIWHRREVLRPGAVGGRVHAEERSEPAELGDRAVGRHRGDLQPEGAADRLGDLPGRHALLGHAPDEDRPRLEIEHDALGRLRTLAAPAPGLAG